MHSLEVLVLSINVRRTVILYWSWFICKSVVLKKNQPLLELEGPERRLQDGEFGQKIWCEDGSSGPTNQLP